MRLINDNAHLRIKPHHQAYRCNAVTAASLETRATKLGWWISHRRSEIDSIGSKLAMLTLGLESFLASDASTCCRGLWRCPSSLPRGILHYFSLFFSLNLWVLLICCGMWTVLFWERERSLSFWINSLSLSLYNYSIYLPPPPFFFYFIRWCVIMLVNWCWWVCLLVLNLSDWLLLCESYLLSGGRWGHVVWGQGWDIWIGEVKACRGMGVC